MVTGLPTMAYSPMEQVSLGEFWRLGCPPSYPTSHNRHHATVSSFRYFTAGRRELKTVELWTIRRLSARP